jgi:hypothetical protein
MKNSIFGQKVTDKQQQQYVLVAQDQQQLAEAHVHKTPDRT